MAGPLPADRYGEARRAIDAWRSDPGSLVACPVCAAPGLEIADRSTRPYAEWYELRCRSCGLAHTFHIPLAPPAPPGQA